MEVKNVQHNRGPGKSPGEENDDYWWMEYSKEGSITKPDPCHIEE